MDFSKIQTLLLAILGIAILATSVMLASKSHKAQYSETARTGFNTMVSIVIAAIGLGAIAFAAFGGKVLSQLGIG